MNREFKFDLQQVDDKGEFRGIAAVYNNVDLGSDMIQRGAFSKTIADNGGKVPLLLDHRIPIGIAQIEDSETGLKTHGRLNLGKEVARDAYSDLKFYAEAGKPYGMSIGYSVEKKKKEGDIRILTEVRLFETSITITPMNPLARVSDVKQITETFLEEFLESARKMRADDPERFSQYSAEFLKVFALPSSPGTSTEDAAKGTEPEAAKNVTVEPDVLHSFDPDRFIGQYARRLGLVKA